MTNPSFVLCLTTIDSESRAEELALKIINSRLGGCVNISQINSFYLWEDSIKKVTEYQLMIKTKLILSDKIKLFINKNHKYDVPEIIFIPLIDGNTEYFNWLDKNICQS